MQRSLSACFLVLGLLVASVPALADVPPRDACNTVGEACDTAGPDGNDPGTCAESTCGRASPKGPVEYPCNRCVSNKDNTGDDAPDEASPEPAPTPTKEPTHASPPPAKTPASGGCAVTRSQSGAGSRDSALAVLLGFVALAARRRRR